MGKLVIREISKQRYLFNDTHAASANVLRAFKYDYQLTANVVYYNDRQKKENYSRSTYYISGDSSLVVEERANSKSMVSNAASTITLEANKEKYFLNNTLNLNAQWIENRGFFI